MVLLGVERRVRNEGGIVDDAVFNAQRIRGKGLHCGADLTGHVGGAVQRKVVPFFAHAAHKRQHVAFIVHRGHGGLRADVPVKYQCVDAVGIGLRAGAAEQRCAVLLIDGRVVRPEHRLALCVQRQAVVSVGNGVGAVEGNACVGFFLPPQSGEVAVLAVVFHESFQHALQAQVHGGKDAQAPGSDAGDGGGTPAVLFFHDIVRQLFKHSVGEIRVHLSPGGGGSGLLAAAHAQRSGRRRVVVGLGDALLVQHQPQHPVAPFQQLFRVGVRAVRHRAAGDGGQRGGFGQRELGGVFAEILLCAGLHAGERARERRDV